MEKLAVYIHGKGGTKDEAEHYKPLLKGYEVIGLDYAAKTPWEAKEEFPKFFEPLRGKYRYITVIANSIGAFFCMSAGVDDMIDRAFFISPVADMEKLIKNMMAWSNVTEDELETKGVVHTEFGEDLSWDFLCYVRNRPIKWNVPTEILYGSEDNMTSFETVTEFAERHNANITVMKGGEHWFHTEEQLSFLDAWIEGKYNEQR